MLKGRASCKKPIFLLCNLTLLLFSQNIFSNTQNTATPWTGFFIGGYGGGAWSGVQNIQKYTLAYWRRISLC